MFFNIIIGLLIFFFLINPLFGNLIWIICDDKDQALEKWIESCPKEIKLIIIPLIISAWPIAVKWWLDGKE